MLCLGSKAAKKQKQGKLSKAEKKRLQKEEEEKRLQEEERREDELTELRHLLEDNHSAVTKWKADSWEKAQWDRYMCCDGTPDPREQREINTYISLWRDNPEVNITPVLEQCDHTLQLIEELEGWLYDVREPAEGDKYQETLLSLQEMISSKLLLATEEILKNACKHSETEMSNMQTVVKDSNITLCLWANLKKNIYFEEAGIGFELSKQLAVSSIAVRILHTRYDHLSWLAGIPPLSARSATRRSMASITTAANPTTTNPEGEEEVRAGSESSLRHQAAQEEAQSIHGSEGRKVRWKNGMLGWVPEIGAISSLFNFQVADTYCSFEQRLVTDSGVSVQVVDLQQYTPLGGVFYWDVFHLPPQAHSIHDWEIRQILHTRLQEFAYPMKQSKVQGSASSITEDLTCPPVGVSVTLPDFVLFSETPQVARWDAQWRMDGITDFNYEASEAKVSFKMDSFHVFVLMQDTYVNLPFQSWELRPLGQDAALFTVNAALIDLTITIQGNQCMLQSEQDKGLSHLQGKWMGGPALQRAMVNAGINIFVNEYTDKYVSTCGKDPLTEHAAYEQMALLSSACAFSWSQWNAKCGAEHLVMQVCEHHGPSPVPKDSWSLYLLGAQRNQKLEITEKSEAFSPDLYPESEFHSTFIHMLQDDMSTDGTARARNSHYLFVDTVQSLLCATRPLMYS
uniref:Dynein axonemal intermediate chain 7 n=1 Tax=Myripristis murdjan TaxID=586833 RepID=A0A667ZPP7_9TELE